MTEITFKHIEKLWWFKTYLNLEHIENIFPSKKKSHFINTMVRESTFLFYDYVVNYKYNFLKWWETLDSRQQKKIVVYINSVNLQNLYYERHEKYLE